MVNLHTVTISIKKPDPTQVYNSVRIYVNRLEKAAALLAKDRNAGAYYAVAVTARFLHELKQSPHLIAAFLESGEIIQRDSGVKKPIQQRRGRDIIDSVALEIQLRCKVALKSALKQIVGNDRKAADHLMNFRKNLTAKRSVGTPARAEFDELIAKYFPRGLDPQLAMKRALGASASMRGREESVKR